MENVPLLYFFLIVMAMSILHRKKKQQTKSWLSFLLISTSVVFLSACSSNTLTLEKDTLETNEVGLALIKGQTNDQAELTIDGTVVPHEEGNFSYEVKLTKDTPQKVIVTTHYKKEKLSKTVTITPSKAFVKHVADEEKRLAAEAKEKAEKEKIAKEKAAAESAIVLSETTPTQENYDKAFTLVKSLTDEKKGLSERLEKVKQTIQLAAAKAEKMKTAEVALATAETQPTKPHYETAKLAIAQVPGGAEELAKRLDTVNSTIIAAEQESARQAAAEVTRLAETGGDQGGPVTTEMVFVTPTGKKYHAGKCGNGTYTEATMDDALARGLTPCSKCF